jgi:hypothetical protein
MLPAEKSVTPRLADVLTSCLSAMTGEDNPLGLAPVDQAVVVLVDGLGAANLRQAAGHARTLSARFDKRSVLPGVFPSTTAVGHGSVCTGTDAGSHGLVGYKVLDAANDRLVNQLNGWDDAMAPATWQRMPTVFETATELGIPSFSIGPARYQGSGLTAALLRGSQYVPAASIEERFSAALRVLRENPRALIYLYGPELDMAAHAKGVDSDRWIGALETLDAQFGAFVAAAPAGAGVLVTADHGVLDVPATRHVLFDTVPELVDGVRHIGGDPRCLYLYLEPGSAADAADRLAERWRTVEGERATVRTRDEAIAAGLFGTVDDSVAARIGDVIVAARKLIAYYDSRETNMAPRAMIGQHGSLTDEESRVPCIRFGAFGRS